ncbi:putative N-acetyltransferase HLS1-like protein [Cinnamomum micranthum f. kanehirae]|uniref:Putative N-acetyltransferase HLS1-like protein n=1 Tax=Cinnamomum micranthum f. kanehirae TaxID=337451 RepID=A0A3S3MY26_9MAGN|nr:putative N-acetyltransferase HLS1-like protein [Cinnamomum micranthum f. kanehirae]
MASEEIKIRNFDRQRDTARVVDLESRCEVGPRESFSLFTDTMGDPMCRIRNSPQYKMLVAELENDLVGVIRGSIKIVNIGNSSSKGHVQAKLGYVLGLRVSPCHRRRGIGATLVHQLEEWFHANHVDYAYMATEKDNEASIKLFIDKLGFVKFRTPAILVNPVGHGLIRLSSRIKILKLKKEQAEHLYRKFMGSTEFFPQDMDMILSNKLSLGTWVAYPRNESWDGIDEDNCAPTSWAILSIWNTGEVFRLRVGKAPFACFLYSKSSDLINRTFPCLGIPFLPDLFGEFGFYFMYGIHSEGPKSGKLVRSLCQFAHNMATSSGDCKVIVTEVGRAKKLRRHIPHWKLLSCSEDLWCVKPLSCNANKTLFDWTKTPPPPTLFVDPREV